MTVLTHLSRQAASQQRRIEEAQRQLNPVMVRQGVGGIPWDLMELGYTISGTTFTALSGEIQFGKQTAYAVAEADLVIAADDTWVFVQMEWGTGISSWQQSTTKPVPTDSHFKKWYYKVGYNATAGRIWVKRYGILIPSIMPVFA